jgi:RNA polymerase sigma-70 factor (ECF subfamily)
MGNQTNRDQVKDIIKSWVKVHSDSMYSWALHKTSFKEVAEDLVQETFLVAIHSFDKFKGDSNPKTWLFSILNHKINDYYRSGYRKHLVDRNEDYETPFNDENYWKVDQTPQQWTHDSVQLLDDSEFNKIWHYCLKKLPDNWFSAIQLKFLEEKRGEFICQELGITNTNFWQILHRAKLQLRKCLELNWFNK